MITAQLCRPHSELASMLAQAPPMQPGLSHVTLSMRLAMQHVCRGRALADSDGDAKRVAVTKCPSTVAQEHR